MKLILINFFNLVRYKLYIIVIFELLCSQMMLAFFNIFNLVSYRFYVVVIFGFCVVQMYGPGLGWHGPTKVRRALGPDCATISTLYEVVIKN